MVCAVSFWRLFLDRHFPGVETVETLTIGTKKIPQECNETVSAEHTTKIRNVKRQSPSCLDSYAVTQVAKALYEAENQ